MPLRPPTKSRRFIQQSKIAFLLGGFFLSILATTVNPITALAFDRTFYSYNDILFYDPDACVQTDGAEVGESASPSTINIEKSALIEGIYKQLTSYGFNPGQVAAIMGNLYGESSLNPDAKESNGIGYGLAQWSFGRRTNLESYASSKGVAVSDPTMQMEFLNNEYTASYKTPLSKTAFAEGKDIKGATRAWMDVFEVPYIDPASTDPARINSVRIPAALKINELYGDGSDQSNACKSGAGIVAGNIAQTAIGLALPTPISDADSDAGTKVNKSDARDTYQVAKEKYNPAQSNGVPSWSDCGGFVSTVMRGSGADTEYPSVGVTVQLNYVRSSSKYTVLEGLKSASQLQPGDILYVSNDEYGHTTIFTGDATYPSADASLDQRVPSVRTPGSASWMLGQGATVARINK